MSRSSMRMKHYRPMSADFTKSNISSGSSRPLAQVFGLNQDVHRDSNKSGVLLINCKSFFVIISHSGQIFLVHSKIQILPTVRRQGSFEETDPSQDVLLFCSIKRDAEKELLGVEIIAASGSSTARLTIYCSRYILHSSKSYQLGTFFPSFGTYRPTMF